MTEYRLTTPAGGAIVGVLQSVPGCARADTLDSAGPVFEGETELFWDDQRDIEESGPDGKLERVWICAAGLKWRESELLRTPVE